MGSNRGYVLLAMLGVAACAAEVDSSIVETDLRDAPAPRSTTGPLTAYERYSYEMLGGENCETVSLLVEELMLRPGMRGLDQVGGSGVDAAVLGEALLASAACTFTAASDGSAVAAAGETNAQVTIQVVAQVSVGAEVAGNGPKVSAQLIVSVNANTPASEIAEILVKEADKAKEKLKEVLRIITEERVRDECDASCRYWIGHSQRITGPKG